MREDVGQTRGGGKWKSGIRGAAGSEKFARRVTLRLPTFAAMTRRRLALRALLVLGAVFAAKATLPATPAIPRTPVTSTSLASVGYGAASRTLEIEFRSGALYRYHAVPAEVHRALMSAESKGRYFSQHIRDRYRFERVPAHTP
jgi:hypothetical protein